MSKLRTILELSRPANVITALSDIIAGMALVGFQFGFKDYQIKSFALLGISSMLFYAAGIILNDIFDRKIDAVERPERAIPSQKIQVWEASVLSVLFFCLGIALAFNVSVISGIISIFLVISIFSYDYIFKKNAFLGPLSMGVCRGLNLILGSSVYELELLNTGHLAIIPILYIFGITLISRGEIKGQNRPQLITGLILFIFVHLAQLHYGYKMNQFYFVLPFVAVHAIWLYSTLFKAIKEPQANLIRKTVKIGVITLIFMNASWVASSGDLIMACFTAALLPISLYLAKFFAVT